MSMTLGNRGRVSSEINVTPMIDVLLVLLVIFMVLPHRTFGESAEIPLEAKSNAPQPEKPIVIQLQQTAENQRPDLKINAEKVAWEDLGSRLEKIYSSHADKVAFLKGDPEIPFQYVADVVDTAHHAGVEHVGLMGK
jgi:biopolymer transport protein ExbD